MEAGRPSTSLWAVTEPCREARSWSPLPRVVLGGLGSVSQDSCLSAPGLLIVPKNLETQLCTRNLPISECLQLVQNQNKPKPREAESNPITGWTGPEAGVGESAGSAPGASQLGACCLHALGDRALSPEAAASLSGGSHFEKNFPTWLCSTFSSFKPPPARGPGSYT